MKTALLRKFRKENFREKEEKLLTGRRDERKSLPRRMKQRGFKKSSQKVFLKISKKVVDNAVTKEHVYERRKKRRE